MPDHFVLISLPVLATSSVAIFFLRSGENLRVETPTEPRRIVMAVVAIIAIGALRRPLGCGWKG